VFFKNKESTDLCPLLFPFGKFFPAPKFQQVCSKVKVTHIPLPLRFLCSFSIPSSSSCKLSSLAFLTRFRMSRQSPAVLPLHPSVVVRHFCTLLQHRVLFNTGANFHIRLSLVLLSFYPQVCFLCFKKHARCYCQCFCFIFSNFVCPINNFVLVYFLQIF
jgi:hypothetical protein